MQIIRNAVIQDQILRIDDTQYQDCTLIDCTLEYSGGPVSFERTNMRRCRYVFFGEARRTVHFLQGVGLLACHPNEWSEVPELVH